MTVLIGIALWALVPGFIAKAKGRSFWAYYLLSFLISPLITMIIVLCISNLNGPATISYWVCAECGTQNSEVYSRCRNCGSDKRKHAGGLIDDSWKCPSCGTENSMNYSQCKKCGNFKNG